MKRFVIFLIILGVLGYFGKKHQQDAGGGQDDTRNPADIKNPVYAEIRFKADLDDRTIHMVVYGKGFDDADCHKMIGDLPETMLEHKRPDGTSIWALESSQCESTLESRSARLFDNKPTFVSYVSASPGAPKEREVRMIFWGVTAQESELVCGEVPHMHQKWAGAIKCVHALPPQ